jgi:hypothetical protein
MRLSHQQLQSSDRESIDPNDEPASNDESYQEYIRTVFQ